MKTCQQQLQNISSNLIENSSKLTIISSLMAFNSKFIIVIS